MIIGYAIRYQWRRPGGCRPGANPTDWKAWREFACLPILFKTWQDAQAYADSRDMFYNLRHLHKVSMTISPVYSKKIRKIL